MGTMALALSIKQLVYDVDHSHPYSAEVKNERNYTSAPLYAFMVWTETTLPSPSSREFDAEAMASQRARRFTAECEVNSDCADITTLVVVHRSMQPVPDCNVVDRD